MILKISFLGKLDRTASMFTTTCWRISSKVKFTRK